MERIAGGSGLNTFAQWLFSVAPEGPQDYKVKGGTESEGNFNFGATGRIFFDPETLLRAAGLVQQLMAPDSSDGGSPFGRPPYGDQIVDQNDIKDGIAGKCEQ
jgi:hypothetical protein